jgi:oxalate---CoA ligase
MSLNYNSKSSERAGAPGAAATIGQVIEAYADKQPDRTAIVSSGGDPLSYRKLQHMILEVRSALRAAGLGRRARIAIAMPDGPHSAIAILAVTCSAVSIPLNPRQTFREIEAGFNALPPDAVVLVKGADSLVRRLAVRRRIRILEAVQAPDGGLGITISSAGSVTPVVPSEEDKPDTEALAFILQTSGTTSEPKLIPTSHRNMLASAARVRSWFDLTTHDRCLCVSPVFYAHGLHVMIFTPLLTGGSIAFPSDPARFDYTEWFDALKPTWYSAGPTLHRLVFDNANSADERKHSLRFILSGGAPLPADLIVGLQRKLKVPVVEHYGSSEGMQICSNQLRSGSSKAGTCGIPSPNTIRIVTDDGSPATTGERGEILIGGPTVVSGYLNAPELTANSFTDGWFKSGDIGSLDKDGFLTLHGRKDDLINRGGEKISPAEIDQALMRHPSVAEAAAYAVPHPRLGQDVAAAVVLRPGANADPAELRKFLQDQLASFKIPARISVHDQLPKGKTGKVLRRQIRTQTEHAASMATDEETMPASDDPTLNALIAQLKEIWERLLNIESISLDDEFSEKGGDSLLATEMLCEVEQLMGQTIPSNVLFESRTVRQLAQSLFKEHIQTDTLVRLNSSGSQPPIFFLHGDYNGGFYSTRLAKLLGDDQPLFVIGPHDLGKEPLMLPVEQIAAYRLPMIRDAQPRGPYRLCGYCMGGLVAFEIARLLLDAGEEVEIVGMIDAPTVSARGYVQLVLSALRVVRPLAPKAIDRTLRSAWYKFSQLDRPLRIPNIVDRLRPSSKDRLAKSAGSKAYPNAKRDLLSVIARSRIGQIAYVRIHDWPTSVDALTVYSPAKLRVPVVYYSAEYGASPWRRISPDIASISLQGDHHDAVRNIANLAIIANDLRERLTLA